MLSLLRKVVSLRIYPMTIVMPDDENLKILHAGIRMVSELFLWTITIILDINANISYI